ncbi:transposase [Streptomyces sp. NPDC056716]|uniref:transposase n=1 Tax=unclassified Streptomyces TaxID=2593676 RepID=UPI0036C96668
MTLRSVQRWRRRLQDSGAEGLRSSGPVSLPRLSDRLFAVLEQEQELAKGPAAYGWPDRTWTLSRIKTLMDRHFHRSFTLSGIAQMLRRNTWEPADRSTAAALVAWLVFVDESGFPRRIPAAWPARNSGRTSRARKIARTREFRPP